MRPRVLLFGSADESIDAARRALKGADVDIVCRSSMSGRLTPSSRVLLAVVVEDRPSSTTDETLAQLVPLGLVERIQSVVHEATLRVLTFGPMEIDLDRRTVCVDGEAIGLTPREFELLAFLATSPQRSFSREELLKEVWHSSEEVQDPATVTEHVRRLRSKMSTRGDLPKWFVTVRNVGYRFEP